MRFAVCLLLGGCKTLLGIEDPSDQLTPNDALVVDMATDTSIDASDDPDNDGVKTASDNCPNNANADQNDEDNDFVGDPCDPCPINMANADGDGDGVGDACDPHPGVLGDAIVAFWGFKTAPTSSQVAITGSWMFDNDARTTGSTDSIATITVPAPADKITITMRVVIDDLFGSSVRSAGGVLQFDSLVGRGVVCGPGINAAGMEGLFVVDTQTNQANTAALAVAPGTDVNVLGTQDGSTFQCRREGFANVSITDSYGALTPRVGIRVRNASAHFWYVLIVRS